MVDIRLSLVADYADVGKSGKLNIMGAFNRISANQFPAEHTQMYLVIQLEAELGEFEQERTLNVELWGMDGERLAELPSITFRVPSPERGRRNNYNAIIQLQRIPFPAPGLYEFKIFIDRNLEGNIPIELVKLAQPESGG